MLLWNFSIPLQSVCPQGMGGRVCVCLKYATIPVLLNETTSSGVLQKGKWQNVDHSMNWAR